MSNIFYTREAKVSFREKSAWVMGTLMMGAGLYYLNMVVSASREMSWAAAPVPIFIPFTLFVVVASIVAQVTLGVLTPKDANAPADERERPLLDHAGHWSGVVLGAGAVTSLLHFLYHQNGALLFHMIMGSLILSQIAEYAFQITLIRRNSNRVRELRETHGQISQAALGDAIGVTRQTIIAIEQGRYSPSLESAFRIARVFGVGLEEVFGWEDAQD
jgi:DNA-binding XRE family transcriptional regulator